MRRSLKVKRTMSEVDPTEDKGSQSHTSERWRAASRPEAAALRLGPAPVLSLHYFLRNTTKTKH